MSNRMNFSIVALVTTGALYGCGSSSTDVEPEPKLLEVPELSVMQSSLKPLTKNGETSFATIIKNGIFLNTANSFNDMVTALPVPEASDSASSGSSSGKFSSTITQEAGVDEADRVKYDGNRIYVASNSHYEFPKSLDHLREKGNYIRVLEKQTDDSLSLVSNVKIGALENEDGEELSNYIQGIYLGEDRLATLYETYSYGIAATSMIDMWFPYESSFGLQINSASDLGQESIAQYNIDGYILSSRRVGDQLIVASTYSPRAGELAADGATLDGAKQNYNQILSTNISEYLPKMTDASGLTTNLVSADNCYVQQDADSTEGFNSLVTLSSFDMGTGELTESVCVTASVNGFYMSSTGIYLYASNYQDDGYDSVIHKFNFEDGNLSYAATGNVEGHFGWNNAQLRFSERDNFLRVVTSDNNEDGPVHKLTVLEQDTSTGLLNQVAQLPNESNPAPIGKPGEDVYAVRYFGDKAYIVTFFRRDPLYVLDLSDNTNPSVLGELDIPGYSAYLHPLGDNFVLGVGQQVDDTVRQTQTSETSSTVAVSPVAPITEGAKVELYDVTNPAAPTVVNTLVFENGFTPAEWDYHALTYLKQSEESHQFALPVEEWVVTKDEKEQDVWKREVSLQLIDVNTSSTPEMTLNGRVVPMLDEDIYLGGWDDRAVIHDDVIFYVHGDLVWKSLWSNPNDTVGPF